jgi:DNA-binding LacI/PurR family transcriptional regulator
MRFCRPTPQDGYEACKSLLNEYPALTAMLAMNDRAVPGVMRAIADSGRKIPHDFSLMALVSSVRMAEMMVPNLTTMESPSVELGRFAAELLIKHLEGKSDEDPRALIPCKFVMGESTGPC